MSGNWILALMLLMLSACGGGSSGSTDNTPLPLDTAPVIDGGWYRPALMVGWQLQLQGRLDTTPDVELYDIDLFDTSKSQIAALQAQGRKVICYFSAGSWEDWRDDAADFPNAVLGNALDGWPGERWLDIRASAVHTIMQSRLQLAHDKGCDGVDPDNMDGYTNHPGFPITSNEQLAYNRYIANSAHQLGLAVALKNDLNQIGRLVDYFDFAVNEQCFQYAECDLLAPFVDNGKPVLNVEYAQQYIDDSAALSALCTDSLNREFSTLVLPLELDGSLRLSCL